MKYTFIMSILQAFINFRCVFLCHCASSHQRCSWAFLSSHFSSKSTYVFVSLPVYFFQKVYNISFYSLDIWPIRLNISSPFISFDHFLNNWLITINHPHKTYHFLLIRCTDLFLWQFISFIGWDDLNAL